MIKKTLAVAGIVAVLLLTFLIPCSALETVYDTSQQIGYQRFIPYTLRAGFNDDGIWVTNSLTLPEQTDAPFLVSRVRELGFSIPAPDRLTSIQSYDVSLDLRGANPRFMQLTAPTLVYTPTYADDGTHNYNRALKYGLFPVSSERFFGNSAWSMSASYVVTYDDGSRYPAEGTMGYNVMSTVSGNSDTEPTLLAVVDDAFSRASVVNRTIASVVIFDYKVIFSQSGISDAHVMFEGYLNVDPAEGLPYQPLDEDAIGDTQVVFDGDVGTADLIIKPLSALLNLPIFGNFTLGSVFAVIGTVGLFVVILKVFAGG